MSEYLIVKSDKNFGVPEQKKFPLPDADHVRSAIKFFNYVEPKYEKELAKAILEKAEEFGVDLSEMNISENNRFSKYLVHSELYHHGILGQKWGIRRFQNKDGSYTTEGKKRRKSGYEEYKEDTDWRKVRSMSDKDLDQKIERLKKEKQYKELRYEQMSEGEKFVHDVLSDAGKKAAKAVAAGALVFAGRAILNKILPGSGSDIRLPKK